MFLDDNPHAGFAIQKLDEEAAKASHGPVRPRRVSAPKIEAAEADLDPEFAKKFLNFIIGIMGVPQTMPGVVVGVSVEEGAEVEPGQGLVTLEEMKMENELQAERAGTVAAVYVSPGDAVDTGALLVDLDDTLIDDSSMTGACWDRACGRVAGRE